MAKQVLVVKHVEIEGTVCGIILFKRRRRP